MRRILIIDDHKLFAECLGGFLHANLGQAFVTAICSLELGELEMQSKVYDLIIIDYSFPAGNGLDFFTRQQPLYPQLRWLLVTMHDYSGLNEQAARIGFHGCLLKEASYDELSDAVLRILGGGTYFKVSPTPRMFLSKRETQVISMVVKGATSKEIAAELEVSVKTVETYRERVLRKTGAKNIADLVRRSKDLNLSYII